MLNSDIIKYKIYEYLNYQDCVNLQNTCKNMPKLQIKFYTFKNIITYTGYKQTRREISYLLSNINIKETPTQLKNNFLDIKLRKGKFLYHFVIYQNIYDKKKDILYYLNNINNYNYTKRLFLNDRSFEN